MPGRPRKPAPADLPVNTYRLEELGYDIPVTGDWLHDQLQAEFVCFRIAHPPQYGGLGKFGHFRRIVDLLWNNPDLKSQKRFVWNPWAERMLRKACECDELVVAGCASAGKCLTEITPVLYADGSVRKAGDVKPGDLLMGDDFKPRRVLETHSGRGPMYRVTPVSGDPWDCSGEHVQVIAVRNKAYDEWWVGELATDMFVQRHLSGLFQEAHLIRKYPDGRTEFVPFTVERIEDGPWVGFSIDGNHRHLLGDFTVTHNSDPFALWVVTNFIADPTHFLGFIMSTTIAGAKKRIWKTVREYYEAIPNLPGKPLWSVNEVQGPTYDGSAYGLSSGIYLLASEQSNEKSAMDKLIGSKAPRTGVPDDSLDALMARPEFDDLVHRFDRDTLAELLPRLVNLSDDRIGHISLVIDEATGCVPSIYNAVNTNLKPGNVGHFQVVYIGNPNSHFDTFGTAATPEQGWDAVTLEDEEWDTLSGGTVIRFNAEKNPRITEKNEAFSWMLREEDIRRMEATYGRESLYYYRMVLGFWSPQGTEVGVYSEADMLQSGAMGKSVWLHPPKKLASLDPSFVNGGDRAACMFFRLGTDLDGKAVLELAEEITLKADITSTDVPVSYQLVRQWRNECQRRGIPPENACYDATGGGVTFGAIVGTQWSTRVQGITSAGKASVQPVGTEKNEKGEKVRACDRYANKATEIWYGAHPFLRSGQLKGITPDLAKEICQRQHDKTSSGRMLKVESKRVYKSRHGKSPDSSDAYFLGIEHAKTRHGLKPDERLATSPTVTTNTGRAGVGTWRAFCERARRLTQPKSLIR
jgi:hypothetical protein